jgi:hypothetical protein
VALAASKSSSTADAKSRFFPIAKKFSGRQNSQIFMVATHMLSISLIITLTNH